MAVAQFRSALIVEVDDSPGRFRLVQELRYFSALLAREIVVPAAYVTDFASIPWVFHSFCQVNGKHRKAAVVHDYLCTHGREIGISQKQADHVFLEAMEVLGVRWSQRRVMYRAVRTYQSIAGLFRKGVIMNAMFSIICIGAALLALTLSGCATPDQQARSLLDRLEFDENETGCVRLDGTIDLNPLPLFKTNANLTLKKQKGDNPPEC